MPPRTPTPPENRGELPTHTQAGINWGRECGGVPPLLEYVCWNFNKTGEIRSYMAPQKISPNLAPDGPRTHPQKCAAHRGDSIPLGFVQIHCTNRTDFLHEGYLNVFWGYLGICCGYVEGILDLSRSCVSCGRFLGRRGDCKR